MTLPRQTLLLICLAGGCLASANEQVYSIVGDSPFIPPDFNPPNPNTTVRPSPQQAAQYSYRGVYQLGETLFFNIFNVAENKSQWIREDTADGSDIRVMGYDLEGDELEVEISGQLLNLSMVKPSNQPIPVQTQTPQRPAAASPPVPTRAVVNASTATDERPVRRRVIRPTTRPATTTTPERRPVVGQ
jgi:hypothetical protein